jgi:hypothetical protein
MRRHSCAPKAGKLVFFQLAIQLLEFHHWTPESNTYFSRQGAEKNIFIPELGALCAFARVWFSESGFQA